MCACEERDKGGCRVAEGVYETEKGSLVVEEEFSGCKLMRCCSVCMRACARVRCVCVCLYVHVD